LQNLIPGHRNFDYPFVDRLAIGKRTPIFSQLILSIARYDYFKLVCIVTLSKMLGWFVPGGSGFLGELCYLGAKLRDFSEHFWC